MPTVDYQPFANGAGANVETQAQFLVDLASGGTLVNGYQAGLAKSAQVSKVARQSSMISAAVANFIANQLNVNVLDDGNLATLITNLTAAVQAAVPPASVWCGTSGGTANAQTLTPTPAQAQYTSGRSYTCEFGFTNTGSMTVAISGLTPLTVYKNSPAGLVVLAGGECIAGNMGAFRYDGTKLVLTESDLGTVAKENIGNGLTDDGSGNLVVKPADASLLVSAAGASVNPAILGAGTFSNLVMTSALGTLAGITVTADFLVLRNPATGLLYVAGNVNLGGATGTATLDTGALATGWYCAHVAGDGAGNNAILLSLSRTAPTTGTKPYFRWVGSVYYNGTGFLAMKQENGEGQWVVGGYGLTNARIMASGAAGSLSTPTWAAVAVGGFVPSTASTIKLLLKTYNTIIAVAPNNSYGADSSTTNPVYTTGSNTATSFADGLVDMVLESTNIYWANNNGGVLACIGWKDNL